MERLSEHAYAELSAAAKRFADTVKTASGGWSVTAGRGKTITLTGRPEAARRHIAAHVAELRSSHGLSDDELRQTLDAVGLLMGPPLETCHRCGARGDRRQLIPVEEIACCASGAKRVLFWLCSNCSPEVAHVASERRRSP